MDSPAPDPATAFASLSTAANSSPEVQDLFRLVERIPDLLTRAAELHQRHPDPGTLAGWLLLNDRHAVEHANIALSAAGDALAGIFSMTHTARALHVSAQITLARQACESALVANWLVSDQNLDTLRTRGFAAAWDNWQEQHKFVQKLARTPDDPDPALVVQREKTDRLHQALIAEGTAHTSGQPPLLKHQKGSVDPEGRQAFGHRTVPEGAAGRAA